MKFDVFGKKLVEVSRIDGAWQAFYVGNEGKKREAKDIVIPSSIAESDIKEYIADLFHELATVSNSEVKTL
jgi:hypothetical protein